MRKLERVARVLFAKAVFAAVLSIEADPADAAWLVRQYRAEQQVRIDSVEHLNDRDTAAVQVLRSLPAVIAEHESAPATLYEEILYPEHALPQRFRPFIANTQRGENSWPGSEVRTLVNQGPVANRINLTIVGDGYTESEREKFFSDAERITRDMFTGKTFASYLPLFNVHAVFVPSRESGISDVARKDTALGLFRAPSGTKRAIMVGNPSKARQAVRLAPATDYPILMANDDYYGGLGGEFAISTRSILSGTVVLRHELGHNFGQVGEEYDSGQVYIGANNASSATQAGWKHWMDEGSSLQASSARYLNGEYVWVNLAKEPFRVRFDFPEAATAGPYRFAIDVSAVGWSTPEDVHVFVDGQKVNLIGRFTDDRSFFSLELNESLKPGPHTLEFAENIHDRDNVLAFANLYALSADYDSSSGKIGAFPVFYGPGHPAGYRPTHNECLMREMRSEHFCAVDQENMWIRFLDRINLIDSLTVQNGVVDLHSPELSGLEIRWYKLDGSGKAEELTQHQGKKRWQAEASDRGNFKVFVRYRTPEVRAYTKRFEVIRDFSLTQ